MARTQAADYEERREAIVEKAAELFATMGFRGASVADLAAACETSKSLIYHYYSSKEDILFAVMTSHLDVLAKDVADVMAGPAAADDRLRQLVHRFMQHYVGAASRQKVLMNELDRLPGEKRAKVVAEQREIIDAVTRLLMDAMRPVPADTVHARTQTMLMFGMINWTHTWFDPTGPVSADELADMVVDRMMSAGSAQAS